MPDTAARVPLGRTLSIARRALTVSFRAKRKASAAVSALGFGMAFFPSLISLSLGRFTDGVQALFGGTRALSSVLGIFAALLALFLTQAGYEYISARFQEEDTQRTTRYMKRSLMDCAAHVQFRYIENDGDFRDKLAFSEMFGATDVAESMQQTVAVLQQLVTFVSVMLTLLRVDTWIVLALLAASVPSVIITSTQKDEEYKARTKGMRSSAMSVHLFYMAAGANEHLRSLYDVRFNGLFPWLKNRWREVSDTYLAEKNAVTKKHVLLNMLADLLRNGVFIVVLALVAGRIFADPSLGLGVFMLALTLSQQLQNASAKLFGGAVGFLSNVKYMDDFFSLLETPKEAVEENPVAIRAADIAFEGVSFSYPGSARRALEDIDVTIRQGEKVAVVGENGSGKSTFVSLLCGLYAPDTGSVSVGGLEVTPHLTSVRAALALVPQHFGRYEASIRDNIAIADPKRKATDADILDMAEKTGALAFIREQPEGLGEVIGTFSETGNNLSGGQWQKVAITRALYRGKARVIVLDEPTAALDPVAEAELYRGFGALTEDKTTLLISHRLGICSIVDRVLVFKDGRIVEDGPHEALLAGDGEYARMFRAQAQWYQ